MTVEQQAVQVLADLHRIEATQHVAHLMLRLPARQPVSGFTAEEKAILDDLAAEDEARREWYTQEAQERNATMQCADGSWW